MDDEQIAEEDQAAVATAQAESQTTKNAAVSAMPQEESSVEDEPNIEMTALKEVAEVLREDPDVSTLLHVVRTTPDIFSEVQPMLSRRDEFEACSLPGELHRTFTPLFAGIALSRRARDILNFAIDRNTEKETQFLLQQIRDGHVYTPEVVVGTGVHAAIYNAERISLEPEEPALTIDANAKIGGQFAQPEAPVWMLNTRTRPEMVDGAHVPGARGSLNTLGSAGTLQQSDVSGGAYGTQDSLSLPTRVNHLLFSKLLSETEVVRILPANTLGAPTENAPSYSVVLRYLKTGEELTVLTDRIVIASGLGEPRTGLETSDEITREILAEEEEKIKKGEDAQVMTFEQFAARVGEESDPFPLRQFKQVAVVGGGDGGAVAVEYLLGHGPDTRMSVAQLDFVEKVFWVGQKSASRDEFMKVSRQRYRDLGLEFPLSKDSEYIHRIEPVVGRAVRLERTEDGKIRVHYGIQETKGGPVVITGTAVVDHIVLSTGFVDQTDDICKEVTAPEEDNTEIVYNDEGMAVARRYRGTDIYKIGPAANLPISERDRKAAPAMRNGTQSIISTKAVWASAEETEELARMLSGKKVRGRPANLATQKAHNQPALLEMPVVNPDAPTDPILVNVEQSKVARLLRPGTISEDVARFVVGSDLHDVRFPDALEGISFSITRVSDEQSSSVQLEIQSGQAIEQDPSYRELINKLFSDELMQAVVVRLCKKVHGTGCVNLEVPLYKGKVELGEITIRPARRHAALAA